jgi:hypothetical protein
VYSSHYPLQYLTMLAVLQGIPHRITRAQLSRLLPTPSIETLTLPADPQITEVVFRVEDQEVTWEDVLQVPVRLGEGGLQGYRPHHRLARLLITRKFRWLIQEGSRVLPQTQIVEMSRQGFRDVANQAATTPPTLSSSPRVKTDDHPWFRSGHPDYGIRRVGA